jgi:hypothetical protein
LRRPAAVVTSGPGQSTKPMRAEIQDIVDAIKQSLGLLRRHL